MSNEDPHTQPRTSNVLLVGLLSTVVEHARKQAFSHGVNLIVATDLAAVAAAFDTGPIDAVIMGAGLDLGIRLDVVRTIFERSDHTTVHMKDKASGPEGFSAFVDAIIKSAVLHGN